VGVSLLLGHHMEHAVIVHFPLSDDEFGSDAEFDSMVILSDALEAAIAAASAGEFDGNELGGGECRLYMYGPSADRLFAAIEPVLAGSSLVRGGYVVKRYGTANDPLAQESKLPL
jgi:hypothetical protein